jgi:condensin complex subunit 1
MLHLIWTKDNNSTTEDGKELKGIRSRLIECYRALYFDVIPDAEPQQQVNRIAKNMIECALPLLFSLFSLSTTTTTGLNDTF